MIVDYTVQLMGPVTLLQLENAIKKLPDSDLVTTGNLVIYSFIQRKVYCTIMPCFFLQGLITINGSQGPVDIGSSTIITCHPSQKLGEVNGLEEVKWFLTYGQNKTTEITSGKEATLKNDSLTDIVELYDISGSWKGMFGTHPRLR